MNKAPQQLALAAALAAAPLAAQEPAVWENQSDEYVNITLLDHPNAAGFLVVNKTPARRMAPDSLILLAPQERAAITANHLRYPLPEHRASVLQLAPHSKVWVTPVQSRGVHMTPAFGPKHAFMQRVDVDFHSGTVALRLERSPQTYDALQTGFVLTGGTWNLPEEAERIKLRLPDKGRRKHASTLDLTFLPGLEDGDPFPPVELPEFM